jgi:hypothetical protein
MKEHWAAPAEQWDAEAELERLNGLLDYFKIKWGPPRCWLALALKLGHKHYPEGVPNPVGRPRRRINRMAEIAELLRPKRQRGRPESDFGELTAKMVDAEKQRLGLSGHGSDKKALESMISRLLREKTAGALPAKRMRESLAYHQKALSRQRGKAAGKSQK